MTEITRRDVFRAGARMSTALALGGRGAVAAGVLAEAAAPGAPARSDIVALHRSTRNKEE